MKPTLKQIIPSASRKDATKAELVEALRDLIDAAEVVVASWEKGNLAGAVNNLEAHAEWASEVLARANRNHNL